MRVEDYEKYMNLVRDLAYVEYDLREVAGGDYTEAADFAQSLLFKAFGVRV